MGKYFELKNMSDKRENIYVYLVMLVIFAAVYFPAFSSYYIHHDDYYYWVTSRNVWGLHPQFDGCMYMGRPLLAFVLSAIGFLVNSVQDANIPRFMVVIGLSITAFLVYGWMRKYSIKKINALLLAVIIFTLPTFQVQVAWSQCLAITLAALVAAISALFAHKSIFAGSIWKAIVNKYTILSIALLLISLATYQTSAMFYWVMVAIMIVNIDVSSWRKWLHPVISFYIIPFIAIALYFAAASLLIKQPEFFATTPYGWAVSADIMQKVSWFINEPMLNAVNLWNILPLKIFGFCFIAILIAGLSCEILNSFKNRQEGYTKKFLLSNCLQKFGFIIILLPLSFLPNLAAQGSSSPYRCLIALSPIVVIVLYWALRNILYFAWSQRKDISISLCLLLAVLVGTFSANYTILNYFVLPNTLELRYIEKRLQEVDLEKYEEIHIIRPESSPATRYDEFGTLTTSFWQDAPFIVRCALAELGKEELFENIKVSSGAKGELIELDEQTLLIDMSNLLGR